MNGFQSEELISCNNSDCTVADTGICLKSIANFREECPEFAGFSSDSSLVEKPPSEKTITSQSVNGITKEEPKTFWSGQELGIEEAEAIMRSTYTHLIGIIGLANSGKSCFLSSLYLKFCSSQYPMQRYFFAGSKSLIGFEERSIGVRQWDNETLPAQLSEHTLLRDPRQPGFMHLRIADNFRQLIFEMLLTDLPGEWFEDLYLNVETAPRLAFMNRADVLLIFIDSDELLDPGRRHNHIRANQLLIARIAETINVSRETPVGIVVSKIDLLRQKNLEVADLKGIDIVKQELIDQGYDPLVLPIASFSSCPELVLSGHGIEDVLNFCFGREVKPALSDLPSTGEYSRERSFHLL